jgi:ElaB/YqjD/DUF883 family membrane-anchored ribosome-binding protein
LPRWRFVGPLALVGVACSDKETADSRQDFENKTQRQLDKIDKRMNELENQVKSSNADDDAKRELSPLKDEREQVTAKLKQAREASDDDWQQIKGDLNRSLDKLNDRVESFSNDLKDKFNNKQGGGQ